MHFLVLQVFHVFSALIIDFIECDNSSLFLIWHFLQELLQLGAAAISPDDPVLSVEDLADQIAEVLNYFG